MACWGVHPLATALLLLGYGLALPIAARLSTVVAKGNRLAIWGHQLGMLVAALGWLFRGQVLVAAAHGLWLALAYTWFEVKSPRRAAAGR